MSDSTMSIKDWLITMIITALPIIGIVMLFVWSFGGNAPTVKANWAKAVLIFYAIMIVLYFIFGAALLGGIMAASY
ncbi:MAG: hypothetical protein Tsb0034_22690 [Ekhidna sp.]